MRYRRRSRNPNRGGHAPRAYDWQAVDDFASASATTWPTGKAVGVQDAIAMIASLVTLQQRFGTSNDIINEFSTAYGRYVFASSRLRHDPTAVATLAHTLNCLLLLLVGEIDAGNTSGGSEVDIFHRRWQAIGDALLTALGSVEQRFTKSYQLAAKRMLDQANIVEVSGSYGRSALGFPVATFTQSQFGPSQGAAPQLNQTGLPGQTSPAGQVGTGQ